MPASRRTFLAGGAAAGVGLAVAGAVPSLAQAHPGRPHGPAGRTPFPPLVDDPAGVLALPAGFRYAVVTRTGTTKLDHGQGVTPSDHDGMAVFDAGRGRYVLIQNHENDPGAEFGVPHVEGTVYDPGALDAGGCTVITTDRTGRNLGEFVAISGTVSNCAGGPTPWGTWLTCEETEDRAGAKWTEGGRTGTFQKDHGYVFEVMADGSADPRPIKCLGRYAHEALAIDRDRTHIYLSEDADQPNGLFYRWTAPRGVKVGPKMLPRLAANAGVLAAMQIIMDDGSVLPDVAYLTSAQLGRPFPVKWIEVPERDARTTPVREQFANDEVTRGRKFEGVWGTDEGVYVVNSYAWEDGELPADAAPHDGMVWFYHYREQTIQLVTYFPHQPTAEDGAPAKYTDLTFDGPDNVSVTPWGSLVLAEDGAGASHVLSSFPGGPTYAIARNQLNDSEFTGPAFTGDGRVLFVNIQDPGLTLAITGPWEKYLG
ncbi:PhoX family protein [Actinoplanes bogorensis]|uniref:PhoX family protein n=1 Tax=Paractinoplanes bogorensis TaxID=1610840 RepID=A0ABS5YJH0_9ACTN|nr:alkaline phosphatase PhoX [Actinoplanes bogorensis]MBU2663629.1 PhoX family protein [Actinoplanes bogorensis]